MTIAIFRRSRWLGCGLGLLLACQAATAADTGAVKTVDQEWRERVVLGWHADMLRDGRLAAAQGRRAVEQLGPDASLRDQLKAWAQFLFTMRWERSPPDYCPTFSRYMASARAAGDAYARELFDLAVGGSNHWTASTCPGQFTSTELEALARTLGDDARMYYALEMRMADAWNAGRRNEALEILWRQSEIAIAPFQRASRAIYIANLQPRSQEGHLSATEWLKRARQAFDGREFRVLEAHWQSEYALNQLAQGHVSTGEQHVKTAMALMREGWIEANEASSAVIAFALQMNRNRQPARALEIVKEFDRFGELRDASSRYKRTTALLGAYTLLGTPEAWAKGQQEIAQLGDTSSPEDGGLPTPALLRTVSDFYEKFGMYEAALRARKQLEQAVERAQLRANETTRVELQEKLNVALKDKENARLTAEAELQAARQRGWMGAFGAAVLGGVGASAALAVAVRRGRRLAKVSAELAERNGELEQRSATRVRLLAAACHDLRQPAHALGILAELGSDASTDPSRFTSWLQSVRRSTGSLSEMLDELMDLGRLDGGHYTPQLSRVSLGELLQEVMLHFGPLAKRKGLLLVAPPIEAHTLSDRHLLRRMLFNLVSNSIKYTDAGSVHVRAEPLGHEIRISVQDTGPGIPQDKLDDVFRDYVRLNPLKAAEGLGIGLSIVRRSAELLGHPITLTSEPGQGTTVSLVLPLVSAPEPASPAPVAGPASQRTGGLLAVIEDDADLRDALASLLQRWHYTVCAGTDAASVLAKLPAGHAPPDLVITDLHLGATNGLMEVARLREALNAPDLPALMVTGDLDAAVASQAAQARA